MCWPPSNPQLRDPMHNSYTPILTERQIRRIVRKLSPDRWADVLERLPDRAMRAAIASFVWFWAPTWDRGSSAISPRLKALVDEYRYADPQPDETLLFATADRIATEAREARDVRGFYRFRNHAVLGM